MEKIACIDGARYILRDSENDLDKDVYIFGSEDGKAFVGYPKTGALRSELRSMAFR